MVIIYGTECVRSLTSKSNFEVSVPSQESERLCTCVLGLVVLPLSIDSVVYFAFHYICK